MSRNLILFWVLVLTPANLLAQPFGVPYRVEKIHADLSLTYTAGNWTAGVRLDQPLPQYNNQLFLTNQARIGVNLSASTLAVQPAAANFNFIGAGAGNDFRRLSQNNSTPNHTFLGIDAVGMNAGAPGQGWANWNPSTLSGNPGAPNNSQKYVEYIIKEVRAPAGAHFSTWFASGGTPRVFASTFERGFTSITEANSLFVPVEGHLHLNWGFTLPGKYAIDVVARTYYIDGNGMNVELRSNPLTPFSFTFEVSKIRPYPSDSISPFPALPRPTAPVPEPGLLMVLLGLFAGIRLRNGTL